MLAAPMEALALMIIGHALADFPLQGDWLARAKNPRLQLVPNERIWPMALAFHSAIHAGAVFAVTGMWLLATLEFVAHAAIDYAKCYGRLSYNADQVLHLACKGLWAVLLAVIPVGLAA